MKLLNCHWIRLLWLLQCFRYEKFLISLFFAIFNSQFWYFIVVRLWLHLWYNKIFSMPFFKCLYFQSEFLVIIVILFILGLWAVNWEMFANFTFYIFRSKLMFCVMRFLWICKFSVNFVNQLHLKNWQTLIKYKHFWFLQVFLISCLRIWKWPPYPPKRKFPNKI